MNSKALLPSPSPTWSQSFGNAALASFWLTSHLHQLEPDGRHSVLANAGTLLSFQLGSEAAPLIAWEFAPTFETHDVYLKFMIDGAPSKPFSATTLSPWELPVRFLGSSRALAVPAMSISSEF